MQRQLLELARHLPARGWAVEVVLFYGQGELLEELRGTGVPVQVIGKSSRWDLLRFAFRLVRHLRRARPDVLYAWLPVPSMVATLVAPAVHRPRVIWGVRQSAPDLRRYDRALRVTFHLSRALSRCAHLVVCNSEAGRRDHLAAGYPSGRTVVIHNGIDTSRFRPDPLRRAAVRSSWGLEVDDCVVGVVARLDPMKGHEVLVESAALLRSRAPRLRWVLVGPGSNSAHAALTHLILDRGLQDVVRLVGGVDDVAAVYNALDLLVLPSLWGEGFPNVVGEAMACGTPAVVTDVGDSRIVVGDTGVVVMPGRPAELADAVVEMIDRLTGDVEDVRRRARLRVTEHFSTERMVAATAMVLEGTT